MINSAQAPVATAFSGSEMRPGWTIDTGLEALHDDRGRRSRVARGVADAGTAPGIDGLAHVRTLDRALLRDRPPVDQQLDTKEN